MAASDTIKKVSKMSKTQLINLHILHGGLMTPAEYASWSKDELIAEVVRDISGD
jgi:hypothetical protein